MGCCATICPICVIERQGTVVHSDQLGLRTYAWSPVWPEGEYVAAGSAWQRQKHDWDEAFDGMPHGSQVTFPEDLKVECYPVEGAASFTIRGEWPNSPDCDESSEVDAFGTSIYVRLLLKACQPVTVKAAIRGSVERYGDERDWVAGDSYATYDRCAVWLTGDDFTSDDCSETLPTGGFAPWRLLAFGHAFPESLLCSQRARVHCGVTTICEGVRYLDIEITPGDNVSNDSGYWEVTLSIECGESALDCSTEQTDPDYHPPDGDPPTSPGDPEEPPIIDAPGPCDCGCQVMGCEVEFSGFEDGECTTPMPSPTLLAETPSNLHQAFSLSWLTGDSGPVLGQVLGTENDPCDPGILFGLFVYGDELTAATAYRVWLWKIEANVTCEECEGGRKWHGEFEFFFQATVETLPVDPNPCGTMASPLETAGLVAALCTNYSFSAVADQPCGDCEVVVSYSNTKNETVGNNGPTTCGCSPTAFPGPDTHATVTFRPIVAGECVE